MSIKQKIENFHYFSLDDPLNLLLPELFFSLFFGTHPKIGYSCLPTHSLDAHRKFF